MSVAGRVIVGFSHPVVAKYNNAGGVVTYSGGMVLARGVEVDLSIETDDDNNFYADNALAESANGEFASGAAKLIVDGLHADPERFILGLPEPKDVPYGESTVKVTKHGKNAKPPYVGIGFVVDYKSGGGHIYVPVILNKGKFRQHGTKAKTREDKTSWQTQELEADLHRDDSDDASWKWVGEDQASEAEAIAVLHGLLNVAEVA